MSTGRGSRRTQGKEARQRTRDAHTLIGGMTGQGKNAAVRDAVDKLLKRSRDTGMPIVISDSKGTKDWPPQP